MALYRENATGFIQEWATNPGAGYTAMSAQPTDTLTNRVNWWRSADVGSLSSAWHPSIQGGTEVPAPPGVNGSGVNVMAWRYSSFEELGDLGYDGLPPFTTEFGTVTATRPASVTGYHGNYRLRLTWGTTGAKIWLGQLVSAQQIELYNIKLTTNRRWIISLYVAPTTNGAKAFNVLLTTKSVAGATAEYTTALSTGATSGQWTRVSFGLDLSADSGNKAVLGFSANSGIIIDVDGIMIEEWVGSLATPSAYTAVTAFVTGEQLVDVAVDKLTAGTITGKTIILADAAAVIKSANWSAGGSGFIIRGDGTCEFGQVTVRGAVNAGSITGGTLNCSQFTVANLSASSINTGTLNCASLTVTNFSASSINTGILNCANFTVSNLNAGSINAGTLNCANFTVANFNASYIQSGTLTSQLIQLNGGAIRSSNWTAGVTGWQIDGAGNAEFNNVSVKGTLRAADITVGTITTPQLTLQAATFVTSALSPNFQQISYAGGLGADYIVWSVSLPQNSYRGRIYIELAANVHDNVANVPLLIRFFKSTNGTSYTQRYEISYQSKGNTILIPLTWVDEDFTTATGVWYQVTVTQNDIDAVISFRGTAFLLESKR